MVGIERDVFLGREVPEDKADPEIIRVSGFITPFSLGDNLAIMDRNKRILEARKAIAIKANEGQSNS